MIKRGSADSHAMETIKKWKWWLFGIILLGGLLSLFDRWRTWKENSQDKHILAAARAYGMDPALIKAVVWRESRFNPKAHGDAGEIGLMQVGELAAQEWASAEGNHLFQHRQLFDPAQNTLAGTWYLRKCLLRYARTDNPIAYALADYNAGRTHVLRWNKGAGSTNSVLFLKQMDYPGTRFYVRSVLKRYAYYRKILFPPQKSALNPCRHRVAQASGLRACRQPSRLPGESQRDAGGTIATGTVAPHRKFMGKEKPPARGTHSPFSNSRSRLSILGPLAS